uniref:Tc1-like transposase DDE domain-containing protein n=1 Tax=Caenorhabditis japonica TaxID=281687 RepID=A0A8R1I9B0_CAEJA
MDAQQLKIVMDMQRKANLEMMEQMSRIKQKCLDHGFVVRTAANVYLRQGKSVHIRLVVQQIAKDRLLQAAQNKKSMKKVARDIQEYKTFIPCLKSSTSGTRITSRTEMEKEIQQFYSKLFRSNRGPPVIASPIGMEIPPPFLPEEVRAAFRSFPNGKAAGDDKITADFLKSCHDNVIFLLTDRSLTRECHRSTPSNFVFDGSKRCRHIAGGPFILQQDWAPSHGSRSTLAVLEAHFPGFLDKNLWPASSPDLNPMDFSVWGMLEGKIAGKVFATVDAALEVAWASIDDGYLRRTVNSVKKRLRACVKARGSNFEILL